MKHTKIIGFAWAGWIFDFFDLILYSFLLIEIQDDFDLTDTEVAMVYSASLAITAVGGIIIGFLGDKLGRRNAIIISVLVFSIGTFLSALSWSIWSLLIFRLITGFGIGGEWAAGHTLINETLPSGERGKASSIIQSGAPIGAGLASIVGGFINPIIKWRMSFILASFPSFILVVLMYLSLPESPQYLIFKEEAKDERDENFKLQGWYYVRAATKRSLDQLYVIRNSLFLGTILSLFGMLAYWVVFSWTPKFLSTFGFNDEKIGWWMLLCQFGAFLGYISFGWVSSSTNKFRLTFSLYAITFGIGILVFSNAVDSNLEIIALLGIFITGFGTGFFSGYGPLYCRLFPIRVRNTAASWCFNLGRLGAFIAPILVAWLADKFSFTIAISVGTIFALCVSLWVFLIDPTKIEYETTFEVPAKMKLVISN